LRWAEGNGKRNDSYLEEKLIFFWGREWTEREGFVLWWRTMIACKSKGLERKMDRAENNKKTV